MDEVIGYNLVDDLAERLSEQTGGQSLETAQGLLNFRDTSARKRRDLTWILALLAGFLFLFDVAQRRLDLLKEPEKKKTCKGQEIRRERMLSRR